MSVVPMDLPVMFLQVLRAGVVLDALHKAVLHRLSTAKTAGKGWMMPAESHGMGVTNGL